MENATTTLALVDALHELTDALHAVDAEPVTIGQAVTEVLHRSKIARLDLVEFLESKGHKGVAVVHRISGFAGAVKVAYEAEYGHPPLQRLVDIGAGPRLINSYLEVDRPLVERTYAAWSEAVA